MTKFITVQDDVQKEKKETVLTHYLDDNGWSEQKTNISDYDKMLYLGSCKFDGDMFAGYKNAIIDIFKGIKGDEFND